MNGRLDVLPSPSAILLRSMRYGTAWGAGAGALVLAVPGSVIAIIGGAVGLIIFLILALIAAAVGAIAGLACGFSGGLGMVILRRQVGANRGAVRAVAAAGAAVPPAIWFAALAASTGAWQPGPVALTVAAMGLAAALGPKAYYGVPPRRRRRARRPGSVRHEP